MASKLEQHQYEEEIDVLENLDFPDQDLNLTEEQMENINRQLDDAVRKGVISQKDRMGATHMIAQIPPQERKNAEKIVEEKLRKKAEFEKAYADELKQAQKNGVLTDKEVKTKLKEYHKMSGKERQKAAKELTKDLEQREVLNTSVEDIIDQSPHLTHKGKRTKEAKKTLQRIQQLDEQGKQKEKLKLVNRLRRLDQVKEICEDREKTAAELYRQGEYQQALQIMKRNQRFTSRYPESPKLKEVNQKAQASITNLEYEIDEQTKVRESREDRDDSISVADAEHSLDSSGKHIKNVDYMIKYTKSQDDGLIPRDEKWVTPYMREQEREAREKHQQLEGLYERFADIDQKEAQLQQEIDDHRETELATNKILQAHGKSYEDYARGEDEDESANKTHIEHYQTDMIHNEVEEDSEVRLDQHERRLQTKEAEKILHTEDVHINVEKKGQDVDGAEVEEEIAKNFLNEEQAQIQRSNLSKEAKEAELKRIAEQRKRPGGGVTGALWNKMKKGSSDQDIITTGKDYSAETNQRNMAEVIKKSSSKQDKSRDKEREQKSQKRKQEMVDQIKRAA